MYFYDYDIETYPNVFTFSAIRYDTGEAWYYEISDRRNDLIELLTFLYALRDSRARMVGFNNVGFDYPVIHFILEHAPSWLHLSATAVIAYIYQKAQFIIDSDWGDRFSHIIWQPVIRQVDLRLIHHFDNANKMTSLKEIEFNMGSVNIGDLPYPPGTYLTVDQIPVLANYNMHDVKETRKFHFYTEGMIAFRDKLTEKYGKDFSNHNDTKIGKDYFIMRLEESAPGTCYWYDENKKRQPRQTGRDGIPCVDIIFSYIQFTRPEFQYALRWLKDFTIYNTRGALDLSVEIEGFKYDFGTGGIHASITSQSVYADDVHTIIDVDVASFYPSIPIANRVYPEHLGELFCDIYKDVFEQRKTHAKKTIENAMLKLALNGVYGDSNSAYSVFYDPKYTMTITINGQLLLCMLAERMMDIPGLSMIQLNTDGVTVKVPREHVPQVTEVCKQWETLTKLVLEDVEYSAMHIRDVNNYIGVYPDGKTKRIGAYGYERASEAPNFATREKKWEANWSSLIVPKAAEAALVHGADIAEFITSPERDIMDFMLRTKTPNNSQLVMVDDEGDEKPQHKVTRYYIAHNGGFLVKVSPPTKPHTVGWLKKGKGVTDGEYFAWHDARGDTWNPDVHQKNKGRYVTRRMGESAGWRTQVCNDIRTVDATNINHEYYIAETRKLVDCIKQ